MAPASRRCVASLCAARRAKPSDFGNVESRAAEPGLDRLELEGLDWIICGAETGSGFRPHEVQWARDMRRRCAAAGVAYFYKQSAAPRTEMGIELDGRIVRAYPTPRGAVAAAGLFGE